MTFVFIGEDPEEFAEAEKRFPGLEWVPAEPQTDPYGRQANRIILKAGEGECSWAWYEPIASDATVFSWFRGLPEPPLIPSDIMRATDTRYLQALLYFLARTMHARVAVEIGVADGSTTWPLLKAVSETGSTLYSVDPEPCLFAKDLVARSGFAAHWQFVQAYSTSFFQWPDAPAEIEFAFIDGDHTADGVLNDAHNVLTRLVPGGIAVFHEWTPGASTYDEMVREARIYQGDANTRAGIQGTPRALFQVLPEYDVDVFPLEFGACGIDRFAEWTEAGALLVRKRKGEKVLGEIERRRRG